MQQPTYLDDAGEPVYLSDEGEPIEDEETEPLSADDIADEQIINTPPQQSNAGGLWDTITTPIPALKNISNAVTNWLDPQTGDTSESYSPFKAFAAGVLDTVIPQTPLDVGLSVVPMGGVTRAGRAAIKAVTPKSVQRVLTTPIGRSGAKATTAAPARPTTAEILASNQAKIDAIPKRTAVENIPTSTVTPEVSAVLPDADEIVNTLRKGGMDPSIKIKPKTKYLDESGSPIPSQAASVANETAPKLTIAQKAEQVKQLLRDNPNLTLQEAQAAVKAMNMSKQSVATTLSPEAQVLDDALPRDEWGIPTTIEGQFPNIAGNAEIQAANRGIRNFQDDLIKLGQDPDQDLKNLLQHELNKNRALGADDVEDSLDSFKELLDDVKFGQAKSVGGGKGIPPNRPQLPPKGGGGDDMIPPDDGSMIPPKESSTLTKLLNFPRAAKTTLDLSAPFRQGLGLIHKRGWWKSWGPMVKAYGDEGAFKASQEGIISRPLFKPEPMLDKAGKPVIDKVTGLPKMGESFAEKSGLKFTDLKSGFSKQEEALVGSELVEKLPVVGRLARRSNRAYIAYLNNLRATTFEDLIDSATKLGLNPKGNAVISKQIAEFVNNSSGRGGLGKAEKHAELLTNIFFSPRLITSRLQMMNPRNYLTTDPMVRKEYWKSLGAMAVAGGTIAGLAKMSGAKVSLDETSSDFLKPKWGNTRLDPWGGFQQYAVLMGRLANNQFTSSTSGKTSTLGSNPMVPTAAELFISGKPNQRGFVGNKLNPIWGFAWDWLSATPNQPFNIPEKSKELVVPIIIEDLYELAQEDPKWKMLLGIPSGVGMGTQTY